MVRARAKGSPSPSLATNMRTAPTANLPDQLQHARVQPAPCRDVHQGVVLGVAAGFQVDSVGQGSAAQSYRIYS